MSDAVLSEPILSARERQLAGLKPWKKGQSGNPGGRRKRNKPFLEALAADYEKNGHEVIETLRKKHPEAYCAYLFGKPVERIQRLAVQTSLEEIAKTIIRLEKEEQSPAQNS